MDVASTSTTQAASAHTQSAAASSSVISSDFETFIQMLTTQAKYQDPLEPIDSTEYAAQLAQFSMVEQQVRTNDSLVLLTEQMTMTNMASLAGWVGMEARAATPLPFDGTPITIAPNPAAIADQVELVVKNAAGQEVQRLALPVSAQPYEWSGVDDQGNPFPSETYSFHVESSLNGEVILNDVAEVYGRVTEAQSVGGDIVLMLEGSVPVLSSTVSALREPTTNATPFGSTY